MKIHIAFYERGALMGKGFVIYAKRSGEKEGPYVVISLRVQLFLTEKIRSRYFQVFRIPEMNEQ